MGMDSCSEKQDEPELGYWIGRLYIDMIIIIWKHIRMVASISTLLQMLATILPSILGRS